MNRRTRISPPSQLDHYAKRLQRESIFNIPRSTHWRTEAQQMCFAPGGISDRLGYRDVTRYYRVAETLANPDYLAHFIDHHAGNAYWSAMCFATGNHPFSPEHVPGLDSCRHLADLVTQFHETLRDRLDAVLEALREEADPDGYYEQRFLDWCAEWKAAMRAAYAMTDDGNNRYERRLRLCRQAAEELFPELLEWFDDIRERVCDGGHTAAWSWGDGRRGPAGL